VPHLEEHWQLMFAGVLTTNKQYVRGELNGAGFERVRINLVRRNQQVATVY
jgi:hypothetical protein